MSVLLQTQKSLIDLGILTADAEIRANSRYSWLKMTMLGKTLTGRYKIVKRLGGGGFSQTFIAEDGYLPDHPQCVIKLLKPASLNGDVLRVTRELFDREAKVLYRLGRHDCIPSLLAHFEEDQEFFLAQELIEGDLLSQEITGSRCLGEEYTINFLLDILPTLDFVHQQQVIHRDLKPSNLIRRKSDHKIVLIDFGAVKEVSNSNIFDNPSSLVIGSAGYMPNEQYSGRTMFCSDIYALGIIAIQALTGRMPVQIPSDPTTGELYWHNLFEFNSAFVDIINRMVRVDWRQRYQSASEVLAALDKLQMRSQMYPPANLPSIFDSLDFSAEPEPINPLIAEVSDDLEMSADPTRAKKLICLVCTGILENDIKRLENFSFVELLQDLYQQYPTIELLKEHLVNAVKTIAVQKQRQYLIVAKLVFQLVSKLYKQTEITPKSEAVVPPANNSQVLNEPIAYAVNHLVINADSAHLVAPLAEPQELQEVIAESNHPEPDIYDWVAHQIDIDVHQMRLKRLLLYTYQDVWENDLRNLNSMDWAALLRELVSFLPTFEQLVSMLQEAISRVSKPVEYTAIGNLLLTKLEPLYPDCNSFHGDSSYGYVLEDFYESAVVANQPEPNDLNTNQCDRKIPFDPQIVSNLFDLRLELMRFTNAMRAKILLFSILYYPFDCDRDNWHDLRRHTLDDLIRQLFYSYASIDKAESAIRQILRSLNDSNAYEQAASYIIQAIRGLYSHLDTLSMQHPAESQSQFELGDTDSTKPSSARSSDDETCQFF
ncbi:serine/threonine-protein kinase [Pseudanabaena mucicola]|uniref:non-specific serine/threonine protein kinase n=1 Tax=Pseudanabaena mucicola FACHB-723 TaxID=2692860 RepID=A0ABR7ZUE5_9CYAN|nr:serine/threonine-protein kinase [Pseudanabaena mucicola]MBD2187424.1 serine/threonine protein kinase [Pseudanabaena mucicola FACHB-723]